MPFSVQQNTAGSGNTQPPREEPDRPVHREGGDSSEQQEGEGGARQDRCEGVPSVRLRRYPSGPRLHCYGFQVRVPSALVGRTLNSHFRLFFWRFRQYLSVVRCCTRVRAERFTHESPKDIMSSSTRWVCLAFSSQRTTLPTVRSAYAVP